MMIVFTNEADEDLISIISQICVWSTTFARGADSAVAILKIYQNSDSFDKCLLFIS